MNGKMWKVVTGLCAFGMSAVWAAQAGAQTSEVKEKPALYTYVADWNIPRAQWADMEKSVRCYPEANGQGHQRRNHLGLWQ